MAPRVHYSGLVIAGIGFVLTRFTVVLAINEDPLRFYLGGVVPLVLGLGLAAFGVALVVADVEAALVRTTALWCSVGAGTMLVLVVLTLVATDPETMLDLETVRSQVYLSNFLIGGSVGGTLTGLYAAHNRRQRTRLRQQANRLEVLNRMLRHEVLNAVTVIKGYATLEDRSSSDAWTAVEDRSDAIDRTIEQVGYLARSGRVDEFALRPVGLEACLETGVETVRDAHGSVGVTLAPVPAGLEVTASDQLDWVFTHLLEYAIAHSTGDGPTLDVRVTTTPARARIHLEYPGPPMPDDHRALLEAGEIDEHDNPRMGFELNVVRLLVENYRGGLETSSDGETQTITVELPRERGARFAGGSAPLGLAGVLPAAPELAVGLGAALVAGVVYGIVSEALGGSIAGIGVFYGTASPVVGWITHEFHSVVFGFVYLGLVSRVPQHYRRGPALYAAIGLGWGAVLWFVAAGIVAPVWLQLLGIPAGIPNLSVELLVNHLAWGLSLGLATVYGLRYVAPRLADRVGPARA